MEAFMNLWERRKMSTLFSPRQVGYPGFGWAGLEYSQLVKGVYAGIPCLTTTSLLLKFDGWKK